MAVLVEKEKGRATRGPFRFSFSMLRGSSDVRRAEVEKCL